MALAYKQSRLVVSASSATPNLAFTSNVAANDGLLAYILWSGSATLTSVSDTLGNAYTTIFNLPGTGTVHIAAVYVPSGKASGANTITFHMSASVATPELVIVETNGPMLLSQFITPLGTGNGTAVASGALTAKGSSGWAAAYSGCDNPTSVGATWTQRENDGGGGLFEEQTAVSGNSYNGTATQAPAGNWSATLILFNGILQPLAFGDTG